MSGGGRPGEGREAPGAGGEAAVDPARLEVVRHLLAACAEEMGTVLRRTAYSPNIKERRDYSCAVFDADARMAAQAAHIPVHLGSMPLSVRACVEELELAAGDVAILNDPFRGGTHLPDVTMVAPVHGDGHDGRLGWVAARAHHADVGGAAPGSMALAREVHEEGLVIPPVKLVEAGRPRRGVLETVLANVRTPDERAGDLRAQRAAVERGVARMRELADREGADGLAACMAALHRRGARAVRRVLSDLPDGAWRFEDVLEDDGHGGGPFRIAVELSVDGDEMRIDFTDTDDQAEGGINAVRAVTVSAVHYVVRALAGEDVPSSGGCMEPVEVVTRPGTLVDARRPAAVAGGNVETSQRVVDVVLGALARARPDRIPAASQGTMNNVAVGGRRPDGGGRWAYYETVAGGAGAGAGGDGTDAIHTHMTNTLNTPVEALEHACPLRVRRYGVRRGSGGDGRRRGGDGVVRELAFRAPATVTLLADRRRRGPYGLEGAEDGAAGRDLLIRDGEVRELPAKGTVRVRPGDVLRVETPGGGGWGGA